MVQQLSRSFARKEQRIEARVTPEQKESFQHAAALLGLSVSDFVTTSALQAANAVIAENEIIRLSREDSIAFANALLHPKEPNTALKDAFALYDQQVVYSE
jgi:uncharacterized protein (DUF1778 family)